jgi:hypothetical protein
MLNPNGFNAWYHVIFYSTNSKPSNVTYKRKRGLWYFIKLMIMNLLGLFLGIQIIIPGWRKNNGGFGICISFFAGSVYSKLGSFNQKGGRAKIRGCHYFDCGGTQ